MLWFSVLAGVAQEPAVENVGHSASDRPNTVWPDLNML
jgi:hypothetical protein